MKKIFAFFITEKTGLIQVVKYFTVGGFSAAIELGLLILLVEIFKINYLIANVIAFTITNLINYALSRKYVFIPGRHPSHREILLFYLIVTIGLLINQSVLYVCVDKINVDYRISKIIATLVTVLWNFFSKKNLVFKK